MFHTSWCSCIGCRYIYNGYILLLDWALYLYAMSFFISCYFVLKSLLCDTSIVTPAFFSLLFAWNIFFNPYTSILCMSLGLKWVSCRRHIDGSCFFIHSATLCLLIGAFSTFIFKLSIDRYVLTAILLSVFWLFFSSSMNLSSSINFSCYLRIFFSVVMDFFFFIFLFFCNPL